MLNPRRKLLGLPLVFAAMLACSSPDAGGHRQVDDRLLDEPTEVFSRPTVATWEETFSWPFRQAEDLAPWTPQGFDLSSKLVDGGWQLGASGPGAYIERATALAGDSVDRLEVVVDDLKRRSLTLRWANDDGTFGAARLLDARDTEDNGRYVFDLANHPQWRGEISRLRLQPSMRPSLRPRLMSVRGLRGVVSAEAVRRAAERPLKVALDQTSRSARLVAPGLPFRRSLDVGPGEQLDVAFGLDNDADGAATFLVERLSDGPAEVLLRSTVDPRGEVAAGHWHVADIDVSPWAGQTIDLRFSLVNDDPDLDDATVYGFWGDLKTSRPRTDDPPPNVILVVVDTLRADHLSLYGYSRPTTPKLERWAAQRAVTFRSAIAASSWTYPSHVSLFTGLDTVSHGQLYSRPIPQRLDLLAEQLQRAGYETMAVTGGGFLDAHYGFARGFDRYFVVPTLLSENGDLEQGLERAEQWTREARRPYFLFFHTYEVHGPHRAREPYFEQFSGYAGNSKRLARLTTKSLPLGDTAGAVRRQTYAWRDGKGGKKALEDGDLQEIIDAYDSAIAYTDEHLHRFFETLDRRGEQDLIVVTSDHGEAFGEHQLAGHSYLYDFNLKVPLLVALPDRRGAGRFVDAQVRQVDVAPTLLAALGLPSPPVDGTSLLPFFEAGTPTRTPADDLAWSATGPQGFSLRRANRLKYMFNPTVWQRQEAPEALFALETDPDESDNLAAGHKATADLQRLMIGRLMQSLDGLSMGFDNPTSETQEVLIAMPRRMGAQYIKSVDAPPRALEVDDQRLRIQVAPGERFSVVLHQATPADDIGIDLVGGNSPCTVDSTTAIPAGTVRIVDGRCEALDEEPHDAFSLSLWFRQSDTAAVTGDSDELPSEVTDQLRALGYID